MINIDLLQKQGMGCSEAKIPAATAKAASDRTPVAFAVLQGALCKVTILPQLHSHHGESR